MVYYIDYGFGLLIGDTKLKIVSHLKKENNEITGTYIKMVSR